MTLVFPFMVHNATTPCVCPCTYVDLADTLFFNIYYSLFHDTPEYSVLTLPACFSLSCSTCTLPFFCCSRTSLFCLLDRLCVLEEPVSKFLHVRGDMVHRGMSPGKWLAMKDLCSVLEPFNIVTVKI